MSSLTQEELELHTQHRQAILKEAQEVLQQEEPTKLLLKKYSTCIPQLVESIRKDRPSSKSKEEEQLKYGELAVPLLLDANDILNELNTHLSLLQRKEEKKDVTNMVKESHPVVNQQANFIQQYSFPRDIDFKIRVFDGTYAKYPDFITAFHIKTDRPGVTKAQKFLVLKDHLGDGPQLLLHGLEPSEESYDKDLQALEDTYNITSRIVDSLHDELIKVEPATDSAKSLRCTYINIESILRAMEHHKVKVDENETICKIELRKFPARIRIPNAITTTEKLTLPLIRSHTNILITNREDIESIVGLSSGVGQAADPPKVEAKMETTAFVATAGGQKPVHKQKESEIKPSCAFCKNSHYSDCCLTYPTAQKRREALSLRSCFACLKTGHSNTDCRNKRPCWYCKKTSHHTAFCPDKFGTFDKPNTSSTGPSQIGNSIERSPVSASSFQPSTTKVSSHLLISKARVTPLKYLHDNQLSIPRLELLGALIATRLLVTVRQALKLDEESPAILYIDSKTVLHWLHRQRILPAFVKNRISEIINTPNLEFRCIQSEENIADLPTRMCSTAELKANDNWWHGPEWLVHQQEQWPPKWTATRSSAEENTTEQEQETTAVAVVSETN